MTGEPGSERLIAGRYRLLTPLGEGGMGTVWRARDEVLHREVAVKEVRAPHGLAASDVERLYARLEREAWAAARVANRNVVTVYDVATQDGRPWIVMEIVHGISLADLLDAQGPVEPARAAHIGAEVLAALRAAHEAGVLHRDVKPANVLMSNDGRVVLTDFGIATVEGTSALTMTGEVIGSPEFLAPERALGRTPGPESDLWSLGVLLYAAVEGNSPFRHDTPLSTLRAIVDEELPPPRRAGPLAPVIEGLLRKDPAERLPADRAEQDLRLVAAGGSPAGGGDVRGDAARTAPYTAFPPTGAHPGGPASGQAPTAATPHQPWSATPPATSSTSAGEPPDRNRRAGALLVVGVIVLALAVAGLTYGLLNRDDGDKNTSGGVTDSASEVVSSPPTQPETSAEAESPSPTPSPSASSEAPKQTVSVTVAGAHTEYSGECPPKDADAPAFTATITVGQLPATVSYRWVSKDGELSGQTWKTLEFPSGGGKSKQDKVVVSTYAESGTYENAIAVEVRDPVKATSDAVPFSVTCETAESPSGEATPSPSASE
ncbi:protein kinase domain-containing protein [Streptomyces sp. NPDC054884]|uniref:serine/threonine-protein kinase n=1 Tax=Streptomyces sp. ME08-AFT2 TaxID=3028683 RepID=UPI0029BC9E33|nr:protein kinase [Streptomyces sp. ME08-AFT2]MDX3309520.1 protein kinase [Streptomyces sp. ME08-AFT2]